MFAVCTVPRYSWDMTYNKKHNHHGAVISCICPNNYDYISNCASLCVNGLVSFLHCVKFCLHQKLKTWSWIILVGVATVLFSFVLETMPVLGDIHKSIHNCCIHVFISIVISTYI